MDNSSSHQPSLHPNPAISVGTAILVGQLVVNIPVIFIILSVTVIGIVLTLVLTETFPSLPDLTFFLGVLGSIVIGTSVGWVWWSFSVPRWRKWAIQKGVPEDRLQKWAVLTGLVWPKGSIFEKTEFKVKE